MQEFVRFVSGFRQANGCCIYYGKLSVAKISILAAVEVPEGYSAPKRFVSSIKRTPNSVGQVVNASSIPIFEYHRMNLPISTRSALNMHGLDVAGT
jgi:hypothetical protein